MHRILVKVTLEPNGDREYREEGEATIPCPCGCGTELVVEIQGDAGIPYHAVVEPKFWVTVKSG